MQKKMFCKTFLIGIIVIFIGAGVIPSMGVSIVKTPIPQENITTIKNFNRGGYIQGLIDNASDGDTIYIPSGIYYENIIIDKSISLIGEDKDTTIIDGSESGYGNGIWISADSVKVIGFTIQNLTGYWPPVYGIKITSNYNTIMNNIIGKGCGGGIIGYSSIGNTIANNILHSYSWEGIVFESLSDNNIIYNNMINSIGTGIQMGYSENNLIINNNISSYFEGVEGIKVGNISNTIINGNTISNQYIGFYHFGFSSNNAIIGNNFLNNKIGIHLYWGTNNYTIHHNNFLTNNINAKDNGNNIWDNEYTSGGNYWDDYNGADIDGDGIGDTPYLIPGGENEDRYPLMYPTVNFPPDKPRIDGPTNGKPDTEYVFSFNTTDLNDDAVMYIIEWGDNITEWTEYGDSGIELILKHTWSEKGNYTIKAKAVDFFSAESDWTEFVVTMTRSKASSSSLLQRFLEGFPNAFLLIKYLLYVNINQ